MTFSRRKMLGCLAAVLLGGAAGCAMDGGVGGTGISTLNGNVANAGGAAAAFRATADHSGIAVRIQGTDLRTVTDNTGWFQIEGVFAGNVVVEFIEAGQASSTMAVGVPAGAEVTLVNIRFDRPLHTARAERIDLSFEATVLETPTCTDAGATLRVTDRPAQSNIFTIAITPATRIEADGVSSPPPTCADLRAQQVVKVRATEDGGVATATRLRIIKSR